MRTITDKGELRALVVCLMVAAFWTGPALAAVAAPTLAVDPHNGPVGTAVTVVGAGFGPDEGVSLSWNGTTSAGSVVAGPQGGFRTQLHVPATLQPGPQSLIASTDSLQASARFVLTGAPPVSTTTQPPTTTTTTPTTTAPPTTPPTTAPPTTSTIPSTTTSTSTSTSTSTTVPGVPPTSPAPTSTTTTTVPGTEPPHSSTTTLPPTSPTTQPEPPGSTAPTTAPSVSPETTAPPATATPPTSSSASVPGTATSPATSSADASLSSTTSSVSSTSTSFFRILPPGTGPLAHSPGAGSDLGLHVESLAVAPASGLPGSEVVVEIEFSERPAHSDVAVSMDGRPLGEPEPGQIAMSLPRSVPDLPAGNYDIIVTVDGRPLAGTDFAVLEETAAADASGPVIFLGLMGVALGVVWTAALRPWPSERNTLGAADAVYAWLAKRGRSRG